LSANQVNPFLSENQVNPDFPAQIGLIGRQLGNNYKLHHSSMKVFLKTRCRNPGVDLMKPKFTDET
jgi:hypothetical protein